jgi:hypothetical protein
VAVVVAASARDDVRDRAFTDAAGEALIIVRVAGEHRVGHPTRLGEARVQGVGQSQVGPVRDVDRIHRLMHRQDHGHVPWRGL